MTSNLYLTMGKVQKHLLKSKKSSSAGTSATLSVPTAGELGDPFLPGLLPQSTGEAGDVKIDIIPYSRKASIYDAALGDGPLYAIVLKHAAKPNVLYRMVNYFPQFLLEMHEKDGALPQTLQQMIEVFRSKLQFTDATDQDKLGIFKSGTVVFLAMASRGS